MFGRSQTVCGWFAAFSYPKDGENCRGYITYATEQYADDTVVSYLNYAHQRKWGQYPVKSAVDFLKTTSYGYGSELFFYTQNIPQIYPESIIEGEQEKV